VLIDTSSLTVDQALGQVLVLVDALAAHNQLDPDRAHPVIATSERSLRARKQSPLSKTETPALGDEG
jgi:hypothetical protein